MRRNVVVLFAALVQAQVGVDWKALIPAIREQLAKSGQPEQRYSVYIHQQADLTGDGIPEALVYLGEGGAYTDYFAVMMVINGKPVFAKFKARDGRISQGEFAQGSSVMHSVGVELRPDQHAIFSFNRDLSGDVPQKVVRCGGEAYRWNPGTHCFEYDGRLSRSLAQAYCRQTQAGK